MAECYLGGAGSKKMIALADCTISSRTYGSTLEFPNGITWADIDTMVAVGRYTGAGEPGIGFSKLDGTLKYVNPSSGNWAVVPYHVPVASDTYIYMFAGSYALTPKAMLATLK